MFRAVYNDDCAIIPLMPVGSYEGVDAWMQSRRVASSYDRHLNERDV